MIRKTLVASFLLCGAVTQSLAQAPLPQHTVAQTQAEKARAAWFQDARFGLFIHWGLYAVPAGEWKGTTNHGEWFMGVSTTLTVNFGKGLPHLP